MLPYLRGRALNLWRWPDGVAGHSFWQKEIPGYAPDWIGRWEYPEAQSSESHTYIVDDQVATMAWLANHATIDMHPWTSRTDAYRNPTYALVDIDPGTDTTFEQVVALARLYRAALAHLGVTGFPKTTGKRGLQIWIPVKPIYSYDQTRAWVEGISRAVGATLPDLVSWEWAKTSRRGRARLISPERGQQDACRSVCRRPVTAARCRRRSCGTSWTTPTRAVAGTSAPSSTDATSRAICSLAPSTSSRSCRHWTERWRRWRVVSSPLRGVRAFRT